ncbi:hydroxypyruvate isomerase family protein [Alicyclobacillus mengziensis]|uniref:TIM barrel protein n=1 Tax=Alicyclobacillus mengziensis TaxID=2931921 RepID=A0A9X7Z5Z4_9BACL|nr:TIM barrel protein [Alicyclobacillus mengziensis]QSO47419.1 TIM barrel protein [Alicyclobacillus mengziensis]
MIFSPSIEAVYRDSKLSVSNIISRISELGFSAFEFWSWWDKDINEIHKAKEEHGVTVASFCTKMISLVNPLLRDAYVEGLKETMVVANRLQCKYLVSQVGQEEPGITRLKQKQSIVDGLKRCAPALEEQGITLLIEPLNTKVDHAEYFLESSEEGFEIIDKVNSPNVKLLYDIYHQQISEGNIIPGITRNLDKVAYLHAADYPGRHEFGTGQIPFKNVLRAVDEAGYSGYLGLEYFPLGDPDKSLRKVMSEFQTS